MAMSITVTINLDESGTYSAAEAAVIQALANDVASPAADQRTAPAPAPAAAEPAPAAAEPAAAPKAAPKAAAAKKTPAAKPSTRAAVLEDTPEPTVDADAEALAAMEADLAGGTPTLQDAVAAATQAIGAGKREQVKAALADAGASRVSELKADGIAAFIAAVQG